MVARDVGRDGTSSIGEPIEADDAQSVPIAIGVPGHRLLPDVQSTFEARHDETVGVLEVRKVHTRVGEALHQI